MSKRKYTPPTDSMYRGRRRFSRKQIVFVAESILCGALDMLDAGLPMHMNWEERAGVATGESRPAGALSGYENGILDAAGMALSIFFAQLTGEGMGAGDALIVAGRFHEKVSSAFRQAWQAKGAKVRKAIAGRKGKPFRIEQIIPSWPDHHRCAEQFAQELLTALGEAKS